MLNLTDLRTAEPDELEAMQESLKDELLRRNHIDNLVDQINGLMQALVEELCGYDVLDIFDGATGEIIVKDYSSHLKYDEMSVAPQLLVRTGRRNPKANQ